MHTDQHLGHTSRFKLEDALCFAPFQHSISSGIVIIQIGNAEIRFMQAHGGFGIMDNGQGAQAKEVHLEQAKRSISTMLNWVTGRPSLVESGTYSVAGSRVITTPAA